MPPGLVSLLLSSLLTPERLQAFYDVRDAIFRQRRKLILVLHAQERAFFDAHFHAPQTGRPVN
jgi:hypothetical protein